MNEPASPLEAQLVQQYAQHLEVVVLLVAHHVYHLVDGIVLEAEFGGAYVLRHVDRRAVGAEQQFLVQPVCAEVRPHAAVLALVEDALLQSLHHLLASLEVGLALVVYFVEADSQDPVCLVEAGIDPLVHLAPQGTHLGVALLPANQHLVCFLDEWGLLLRLLLAHSLRHEGLHLFTIVLVECHVVVPYQVVALLSAGFGSLTVAPPQPRQHALADVYAAVVHDVRLHHTVAVGLHDVGQRPAKQVVAHVAQVKRLVRVGARVLYHYQRRLLCSSREAEAWVPLYAAK